MILCPKCSNELNKNNFICSYCKHNLTIIDDILMFHPEMNEQCKDYNSSGLDDLYKAENKHFWFIQRKKIIKYIFSKYVPKTDSIIEIGAGTGNITRMIQESGYNISAGEIHLAGLKYAKSYNISKCYQFDLYRTPFIEEFDTICMFDVLEHLENENNALTNIAKALNQNGKLVLTVPAYNFLWSRDDVIAAHKRRYTKKHLETAVIQNGFKIVESKYFFSSILPFLFIRKIINRDKGTPINNQEHGSGMQQSSFVNIILNLVLSIEFYIFKIFSLPFGGSIILIARKNK